METLGSLMPPTVAAADGGCAPLQEVARVSALGRSMATELVLLQELEKHLLGDDD
jgi:hypothetical protein